MTPSTSSRGGASVDKDRRYHRTRRYRQGDLLQVLRDQRGDASDLRIKDAAHGAKPGPKLIDKIIAVRVDFFLEHPEYLLLFHQVP